MQVWTVASGKTAAMASGKPFRPSTTAIRTSSTPPVFELVHDLQPELGALVPLEPQAQDLLRPVGPDAQGDVDRLVPDQAFIADLDPERVEEDQRVDRLQRPGLPGRDLLEHRVRHRADQVRRDLDAVELAQVADDLPRAHAPGVHRDDLVVEAWEAALVLGDQPAAGRSSPAGPGGPRARSCRCR